MVADLGQATIRPSFFVGNEPEPHQLDPANSNFIARSGRALHDEPELQRVLDCLGIPLTQRLRLASRAAFHGTSFQCELLASGLVREEAYFAQMARGVGVGYLKRLDPRRLVFVDDEACIEMLGESDRILAARYLDDAGELVYLVAPSQPGWRSIARRGVREFRRRLKVVAPSVLRAALLVRSRRALTQAAQGGLSANRPECSARDVVWPWQAYGLGMLTALVPVAFATVPALALFVLHLLTVSFFIACSALRAVAAIRLRRTAPVSVSLPLSPDVPVYSVLVALYREAEVVPELLVALGKLQWPRSKLEIKLVCEEDDAETIAAINALQLNPCVEVVLVPPSLPRTKPKALAYALPLTRGQLVVLYDAEDRPHPMQLAEALQRFNEAGPELACLQAPLEVSNRRANMIANMFGFEYAALFRGLLPWLAHSRLMLPLGGTSNHFRREALQAVGGWDPYNVTEDADLGVRFARRGYRCETLQCPTREEAPEDLATWHHQRVRWFKGWMQTWLVLMRQPRALAGELSPTTFAVTQILIAGMVLSSLLHVVLLVLVAGLAIELAFGVSFGLWQSPLLVLDLISIFLGYASFLLLGWVVLSPNDRKGFWKVVLFTPIYWIMLSRAAWYALVDLVRRPHYWAKTPHRKARAL